MNTKHPQKKENEIWIMNIMNSGIEDKIKFTKPRGVIIRFAQPAYCINGKTLNDSHSAMFIDKKDELQYDKIQKENIIYNREPK